MAPTAITKASSIPLHWLETIKAELDRDVALGVIEPVPPNTPSTWCSRMSLIPKKDGTPRRVIDLRPLNSATTRQTHLTDSPFNQAIKIPPNTWKTCSDAWNGYHSVPLDEASKHYTTFLTPFGRYRYCVSPQGQSISNDSYMQMYDIIMEMIERYTRCIDDTLLWD